MRRFHVTVRTGGQPRMYYAIAPSAALAYDSAAEQQGDRIYSISVRPA